MTAIPRIRLDPRQPHRLFQGHLWVYSNEIAAIEGAAREGGIVDIVDAGGRFCARGYYNSASRIPVRVLCREPRPIDTGFWRERIQAALDHRERVAAGWPARRLVSSEGDLLPGLIVDQYGDHLVVQATTRGIDQRLAEIVPILVGILQPTVIIERDDLAVRALEGLPKRSGILHGSLPGPTAEVQVRIGDVLVDCDLMDPHKTGTYLDQQTNHRLARAWCRPGMRVLDAFCHLGGFGIHAALGGAGAVDFIDTSAPSLARAEAACIRARVGATTRFRCEDAFAALKTAQAAGERYDLIILDPPSFTKNRQGIPGAIRGYREIHVRALRMLGPGGVLITSSCSHHVGFELFRDTILGAATDARVQLRQELAFGAAPDHPILPAVPETDYLKGMVLTVADAWHPSRQMDQPGRETAMAPASPGPGDAATTAEASGD